MVIRTCPEGQEMVQAPRELIAGVCVDGLEQTEDDPNVHGQDVEVARERAVQDGTTDGAKAENHDLNGGCVFGSQTKGSGVLVVNLVDVLVEERRDVHQAVGPVVPGVFHDKENNDLIGHLEERRERNGGRQSEILCHGVEQPDLRQFDSEVAKKDKHCTLPLFLQRRNFLLPAELALLYCNPRPSHIHTC